MDKVKEFLSGLWGEILYQLKQLSRHDLMLIAGTTVGVAAIVWLSVILTEDEFYVTEKIDPAFEAYISDYTAGVVSAESSFQIRFTREVVDSVAMGKMTEEDLFRFSPSVKGTAYWKDTRTVEFLPENKLESGKTYQVKFALEEVMNVSDEFSTFGFAVLTMEQNYDVKIDGLTAYKRTELSKQKLKGVLLTADFAEASAVERMLSAVQDADELDITWDHQDSRNHYFTVENIARRQSAGQVVLTSRGAPLDVYKSEEYQVKVPPLYEFSLVSTKIIEEPEQYVELWFSDPLQKNQNLKGLVKVGGEGENTRFITDNNILRIYTGRRITGATTLVINEDIKNVKGEKLNGETEVDLFFESVKPAVRMVNKGVIISGPDGLLLPFEAVNLKAVDVMVVKIPGDNMAQFFQVNQYNGGEELQRVGLPIAQQQQPLNASGITDLAKWNQFTLDLSKIIGADPGAMYQINFSFRKSQSLYTCTGTYEGENERDDPCSPSYDGYHRRVQQNILISDLGIIAKKGEGDELLVTVTDLTNTRPKYGVELKILDFQKKELVSGSTNGDGQLRVKTGGHPFLIVAEDGEQRGYLRIDDSTSLPVSHFEVSGQKVKKGLKGFIYSDRGVWHPGDSLNMNFVLEDQVGTLPEYHPVIFELENPQGQVIQRMVRNTSVGNIYNFSAAISEDAVTGNWTARVRTGGAAFFKKVRIEASRPNRLKINLDFRTDKFIDRNKTVSGDLQVAWLNGTAARNLKVQYDLLLSKAKISFKGFPDFSFEDEGRGFEAERKEVFDGRLDNSGNAKVRLNLPAAAPMPGIVTATFIGKVFEEGGSFSSDHFSIPYYPYSSLVGLRIPEGEGMSRALLAGEPQRVDLIVVDPEGNPVPGQTVDAELYKLDWKGKGGQPGNNISGYIDIKAHQLVSKKEINLSGGKGAWTFSVAEEAWGSYYVRVCNSASGHCAGKVIYLDLPGFAGRGANNNLKAGSMLDFSADKGKYQVGEEATIIIPDSNQGRALVSLEDGSQVLESYWVKLNEDGETSFAFEVTRAMAPNVYIHVSLLQPHALTTHDMPARSYGIIALAVEDPATRLEPLITMPKKLEPKTDITIRVSEKNKKPMAYTIAMVDEELLAITDFKTPAPHEYFYAREALGVKTWDLYNYVNGAYGGRLDHVLSVWKSDSEIDGGTEINKRRANQFKPVVKFLGPFFLEGGQENKHTFMMPDYVGSVRTMVVAAGDGAYGHAEVTRPVNKPLMVSGTLPLVLSPKESVKLPVDVFAMESSVKSVRVSISTNNLLGLAGKRSEELFFAKTGNREIDFELRIPHRTGLGEVQINAASGPYRAEYKGKVDIRNPVSTVVDGIGALIEPGETWQAGFTPVGIPGTSEAVLELSGIPPLNLSGRLNYLKDYPHTCIEQVISAGFPQLFLQNVQELSEAEQKQVQANVRAAIRRMSTFQTDEGAFAYWPGDDEADEWATSYAGHFLLKAEEKGYQVPAGLLKAWSSYQRRRVAQGRGNTGYIREDLVQVYRLYTLALGGNPDQGAMDRMREDRDLSLQAKWRLAAAYVLAGKEEVAEDIIEGLSTTVPDYRETYGTYGSSLRDKAMILETLSLLGRREQGMALFREISSVLNNENQWLSTQTTAYCLVATTGFVEGKALGGKVKAAYTFNNKTSASLQSDLPVAQREISLTAGEQQEIQVENQGEEKLYVSILLRGIPEMDEEKPKEKGLQLKMLYKSMDGKVIDPSSLRQGTDFVAEVTVYNPGIHGDYHQLALTHMLPSGWNIISSPLQSPGQEYAQDMVDYQNIRDNRVYTYFDLQAGGRKTIKILLNAAYAGHFYLPSISCEAMYDNTIHAHTQSQWVKVVQPE